MKIFKNTFSREKKLYYFDLWNYCDREGTKKYFATEFENNLFIVPKKGEKGSVWHVDSEVNQLKQVAIKSLKEVGAGSTWNEIKNDAWTAWNYIKPYALGRNIENIQQWKDYQKHLLLFWTAMNSVVWESIDSPEINPIIKEEFVSIRKESESFVERTSALVTNYFEKNFLKYKNMSHFLTFDEMVEIAENKFSDAKLKEIQKRQNGCFLLNGIVYSDLKKLAEILKENNLKFEEEKIDGILEIRGVTAMRGYAKGKVKIIKTKNEISKIKKGGILVTQMTSPDYVPAIKISSAIVTDEGGSLCHAAIVSRELGIPCVIGTKIATRALQDGDLVEVDANNGVVKIIEKKERQEFSKAYTRDFSIIMQEAWFYANKEGFIERLGLSDYPYNPPYIYFMKDRVEEVWENKKANEWLYERLSERLENDASFFDNLQQRYFEGLDSIQKWWKKDIQTIEELKTFIDAIFPMTADFLLMYGATLSEALPENQQTLANEFREKDVFFAECNTALEKGLQNVYPELGQLVLYVTKEELSHPPEIEQLEKRDEGFALVPGIFSGILTFDQLRQKFSEYQFFVDAFDSTVESIAGQTAYRGNVTGRVRIIKRKDQINSVVKGEIIVSPMTTPEMVAGMKKALGFVTDEGGITCHAAIIAREMKKPCIIGTKIATQVLKDGDLVEVNANKGTITIIR